MSVCEGTENMRAAGEKGAACAERAGEKGAANAGRAGEMGAAGDAAGAGEKVAANAGRVGEKGGPRAGCAGKALSREASAACRDGAGEMGISSDVAAPCAVRAGESLSGDMPAGQGVRAGKDSSESAGDSSAADAAAARTGFARSRRTALKLGVLLALALLLVLAALFAENLCPFDPYAQNLSQALQVPSAEHLLGCDRYGRDMLSRVLVGGRASILSTLACVAVVALVGTVVGVVAGWRGGALDTLLMRLSDIFLAFPGLVFALAVAGVLGGGIQNAVIALAAIGWPKFARIARSQTLAQRSSTYLQACRMQGCGEFALVVRHVLPNILGPVAVCAVLDVGTVLMELAGLSYLGLGAQPPMAEWGSMMSDGRSMLQTAPWCVLAPGLAIFVTVLVFNLLGDTLRDFLDPNLKGGRS